jgi:H+/Cl- antiporter ClcA
MQDPVDGMVVPHGQGNIPLSRQPMPVVLRQEALPADGGPELDGQGFMANRPQQRFPLLIVTIVQDYGHLAERLGRGQPGGVKRPPPGFGIRAVESRAAEADAAEIADGNQDGPVHLVHPQQFQQGAPRGAAGLARILRPFEWPVPPGETMMRGVGKTPSRPRQRLRVLGGPKPLDETDKSAPFNLPRDLAGTDHPLHVSIVSRSLQCAAASAGKIQCLYMRDLSRTGWWRTVWARERVALMQGLWEPVLMGTTLGRWLILGSITGALVGAAVTGFLKALFWSIARTAHLPMPWWLVVLPLGGFITGLLIHYGAPDAAGHGTEAVIRAVHRRSGYINWKVAPIKALSTITTLAAGGSAGKEGPSAQIGSALASFLADLLRFPPAERRRLVICGIGAGFAAVFGTPVAGAILGIEVLAIGQMAYEMLVPAFAAAIVSYEVARGLGMTWSYPRATLALAFSPGVFLRVVLLGVAAGLVAWLLVKAMGGMHRLAEYLREERHWWPPLLPAGAGVALGLLTWVTGRAFLGLSLPLLYRALAGEPAAVADPYLKGLFVAITLGLGMSGGIITPLFVIGATMGASLAGPLHLPVGIAAEIGMVAATAAGANVPIAAVILGMEVFGAHASPYFLAAAVPAFLIIGNNSVYPSQRLAVTKSPWVPVALGQSLEDLPDARPVTMERTVREWARRLRWRWTRTGR